MRPLMYPPADPMNPPRARPSSSQSSTVVPVVPNSIERRPKRHMSYVRVPLSVYTPSDVINCSLKIYRPSDLTNTCVISSSRLDSQTS